MKIIRILEVKSLAEEIVALVPRQSTTKTEIGNGQEVPLNWNPEFERFLVENRHTLLLVRHVAALLRLPRQAMDRLQKRKVNPLPFEYAEDMTGKRVRLIQAVDFLEWLDREIARGGPRKHPHTKYNPAAAREKLLAMIAADEEEARQKFGDKA